jgi:peptidoglycan/LPS O-acetylase OafA/YrhL
MTDRAAAAPALSSGYIPTLDGWRAIAILLVMVCHGGDALFHATGLLPSGWVHRVTRHFAFGVDIFFGLSGLLITSRLLAQWQTPPGALLRGFYVRRLFRILPPYLTYLAVLGLLAAAGALPVTSAELVSCLLFVRNYLPAALGGWYTGQFWSLAIEEHFYLLWPLLLLLLGPRRALWGAVGLAVGLAAWRSLEFRQQWLARALPGVDFYTRTDIRLDGLLWGSGFALLLHRGGAIAERLRRWLTGPVWLGLVGAVVACLAVQPPFSRMWAALLVPLLLVGTILRPGGWAGRLLESAPLRFVGRISYGLYVWQQLFLVGVGEPRATWPVLALLQQWPFNLLATFGLALLSHRFIEAPLLAWGRRFTEVPASAEPRLSATPAP